MLQWISGRGAANRAAVKRARDVIEGLQEGNAVVSVSAITDALEGINNASTMPLGERYSEIQNLDLAAVAFTGALLREYLNTSRQKKLREGELWNTAYACWSELATAYVRCVQLYAADVHGAVGFRHNVPVALARAVRALRRQLQWARIRYATPSAELWAGLANLYSFAEEGNVNEGVLIYAGETTTIKLEFLTALMQSVLSCENLQPPGQDLASSLVNRYASMFVLSKTAGSEYTHWFDLKHPQVPARSTRAPQADADARYFGAGPAVAALENAMTQIKSTRELPADLLLAEPADPAFVGNILEHVHRDWSGKTQARLHERQKINARITVVPGFKDILRTLEFVISDSLDFTDQPTAESWVVDDVSEGGYGALIPAVAGDWVEVGSLVGVEGDIAREWRVGVVRRVARVENNQQRVGVQLLSRNASLVRMQRADERPARMNVSQRIALDQAILLNAEAAAQAEVEVLVRSGSFTSLDNVYMLDGDQQILLQPRAVIERNAACERVAFTVVKDDA